MKKKSMEKCNPRPTDNGKQKTKTKRQKIGQAITKNVI